MPLQDIFWATLMFAGFALAIWLLFVALRDLFDRSDVSAGARVGWTVAVCVLPIVGSLIYLGTRSADAGELHLPVRRTARSAVLSAHEVLSVHQ